MLLLRRVLTSAALVLVVLGVSAQAAAADPVNAKNVQLVTGVCGGMQIQVVVNGNGTFTPAHVIGSTAVFVPTAFDLTFSFTPTGGTTQSDNNTAAKANQSGNLTTCAIPQALNTFTSPEGTFSLSGTVIGFFTPGR